MKLPRQNNKQSRILQSLYYILCTCSKMLSEKSHLNNRQNLNSASLQEKGYRWKYVLKEIQGKVAQWLPSIRGWSCLLNLVYSIQRCSICLAFRNTPLFYTKVIWYLKYWRFICYQIIGGPVLTFCDARHTIQSFTKVFCLNTMK